MNLITNLHLFQPKTQIEQLHVLKKSWDVNRPFPKLSKNRTWGIFAFSKIWLYKLIWNVMKDKSWKFCFNSTSRSKVIVLSFLVKLLSYYALPYPASFSCKHAFSMLICSRTRNTFNSEIWYFTHWTMVYLLKKESCSNSNFNFRDDVIFWLHHRFRERSIEVNFKEKWTYVLKKFKKKTWLNQRISFLELLQHRSTIFQIFFQDATFLQFSRSVYLSVEQICFFQEGLLCSSNRHVFSSNRY